MNTFSKLFVALFLTLFTIQSNAQTEKEKFGKLDPKWVKMETYEADPDAAAVYLHNVGHVSTNFAAQSPQTIYKYHVRIKILKESALDLADQVINYVSYRRFNSIAGLKAMTYTLNENGKVESYKLSKENIYDEELTNYYSQRKLAFPNVKVGSVIEFSYQLSVKSWGGIADWYFQRDYPVLYTEYSTAILDGLEYRTTQMGEVYPIQREAKTKSIAMGGGASMPGTYTRFIGKDIPGFVEEPYTAAPEDYMSRMEYQLVGINFPGSFDNQRLQNWSQLTYNYLEDEDYGKLLESNGAVKKLYAEIIADKPEDIDQKTFLYNYVKNNYTWNGYHGKVPSESPSALIKEKEGNAAALNFLLMALAKEAGYRVCPVMISTRENGRSQSVFPDVNQFDHSVALIAEAEGDDYMIMDACQKFLPIGMLPIEDLNGNGLLIDGRENWVNLKPSAADEKVVNGMVKILSEGGMEGDLNEISKGYRAYSLRKDLDEEENKDEWAQNQMTTEFEDIEVDEFEIHNLTEENKAIDYSLKFACTDYVNASGGRIYIQPLLSGRVQDNPFISEKRNYPVDFAHPIVRRNMMTFILPEGFEVESLPEPVKVAIPDRSASFTYNVQNLGKTVQISSLFKIDNTFYMPETYEHIRSLFDFVVKKHAEQIVIKKKIEATAGGE